MAVKRRISFVNNVKINIVLLILLITNIVLYISLIKNFIYNNGIDVDLGALNNILTMVSAIIILGFISTRLPQFRKLGDSSIYEIGYLIIIGILSITVSYFNKSTDSEGFFYPFLEMFKVLSVMLIFTLIASKTDSFKNLLKGKATRKNQVLLIIIFSILGCIASLYHVYVGDTPANVRSLIIMIGGLLGGPVVGIPSAIISGVFRFYNGGPTAFPCAIATILSGFIGSLFYVWNGRKFVSSFVAVTLMFLYIGFEMLLIVFLTPDNISIPYISHIYPLMLFGCTLGMILFIMIIREANKNKKEVSYEQLRINELETTLDEFGDKIDNLENDIEIIKNENNFLYSKLNANVFSKSGVDTIKLNPDKQELDRLREFIADILQKNDFHVDLISEEIFVNIIKYSNCEFVKVNANYEDSILLLEFVDNGIEFNPILNEESEVDGFGIFLTKQFADELHYKYENGENHFMIIKKI